jgi:hypothetical protein
MDPAWFRASDPSRANSLSRDAGPHHLQHRKYNDSRNDQRAKRPHQTLHLLFGKDTDLRSQTLAGAVTHHWNRIQGEEWP